MISIHAPPRGATEQYCLREELEHISIHAPPRGATNFIRHNLCEYDISIHAPPRGATHPAQAGSCLELISIHAPPRGATSQLLARLMQSCYFNSRPSARGDATYTVSSATRAAFQFTPLREGRRFRLHCEAAHRYFNSRPSARGDPNQRPRLAPLL